MVDYVITAGSVLTMDPARTRADAVAVSGERIVAVGSVAECSAALPGAEVRDSGAAVLMPGFIDAHSHPVMSGVASMPPAYYIAPWVAPTWDDVLTIFQRAIADTPPGSGLSFFGYDGLLQKHEAPTAASLDAIFGDRLVLVYGNSGHTAYVSSAVLAQLGWIDNPPADPVGGSYGRLPDGGLDGSATEVAACLSLARPVLAVLGGKPLAAAVEYYAYMSEAGITSTSEHTYQTELKPAYEALATMPHCPLRVALYHMSTDADCGDPFVSTVPTAMLHKRGIKLWADGSPWVGNIAMSEPYLDTAVTQAAGIEPGVPGEKMMNYSRETLDTLLDAHAPQGWQMAFHVNGDIGLDIVLDAFGRALDKHGLAGTDHRWRVEHVGGARRDQFQRAAGLGVVASMGPFQFYYWGDLLDGEMFAPETGAGWQRFRDAFDAGVHPSFHNDGSVTPPTPLLNVQTAVTRRTSSGTVHGPDQAVSLWQALCAETVNAAYALGTDGDVGSIEVGKLADFVELAADPYEVPEDEIGGIEVLGTWVGGTRIDLETFVASSGQVDHAAFERLRAMGPPACCHHAVGASAPEAQTVGAPEAQTAGAPETQTVGAPA